MPISDNLRGALYMNVAMASFTINDSLMKAASDTLGLPIWQATALRGLMTLPFLVLVGVLTGNLAFRLGRADRIAVSLRSLGEVASTVTFLAALVHMDMANLSAIMQALPLAVTLAAWLFLKEPVGWRRLLAILVGFVGVLLIIRPGPEGFDRWSLLAVVSVGFVVLRDLSTRKLSVAIPSATVAVLASGAVTAMALVLSLVQGWVWPSLAQFALLAAAATSLVVGYNFVVMTMRVGDMGFVAPFRYTSLLWALVLGWLIFGTFPDLVTMLGAGLVVGSGIFTLWREHRVARRARLAA